LTPILLNLIFDAINLLMLGGDKNHLIEGLFARWKAVGLSAEQGSEPQDMYVTPCRLLPGWERDCVGRCEGESGTALDGTCAG